VAWKNLTTPSVYAVDLQEFLAHARTTTADEDQLALLYLQAATDIAESRTRRALINRTVQFELDAFPSGCFELPVSPVSAVAGVQYYDTAGSLQTVSSSTYVTDLTSILPRIALKTGSAWPTAETRPGAVRVTFTAGYGATHESVPAGFKLALMMLALHFFENRTPVEVGSGAAVEVPMTLGFALDVYKIASL
jgi:uncharacterized phiE125 gp8 family phage protein